MKPKGCLLSGTLWVALFGFWFLGMITRDCPDTMDVCSARDNLRWAIWWLSAVLSLGAMVLVFLYRPAKGSDDL
ncbi:hypothetical protein ACM61V_06200 [Sphingomonas sp. TX0543]|uniref:hypothetical protein n=1 Tax=unclassified Sphingomonas TaxID=196159 RepID=UPI0010F57B01|nr:hypothetical protein [Sphingomonas sp. 3P27F8]